MVEGVRNETQRRENTPSADTSQHEYNVSGTDYARLVHSRSNRRVLKIRESVRRCESAPNNTQQQANSRSRSKRERTKVGKCIITHTHSTLAARESGSHSNRRTVEVRVSESS